MDCIIEPQNWAFPGTLVKTYDQMVYHQPERPPAAASSTNPPYGRPASNGAARQQQRICACSFASPAETRLSHPGAAVAATSERNQGYTSLLQQILQLTNISCKRVSIRLLQIPDNNADGCAARMLSRLFSVHAMEEHSC